MNLLTRDEAVRRYGPIENGKWAHESKWCVGYQVPKEVQNHWINSYTGAPTDRIYINVDMLMPLTEAIENLMTRGLDQELKTFDGCFQVRDVRGMPGQFSWHSYALAIDLNAKWNPLGGNSMLSAPFVTAWRDAGFVWGGDFQRKDPMHFQYGIG